MVLVTSKRCMAKDIPYQVPTQLVIILSPHSPTPFLVSVFGDSNTRSNKNPTEFILGCLIRRALVFCNFYSNCSAFKFVKMDQKFDIVKTFSNLRCEGTISLYLVIEDYLMLLPFECYKFHELICYQAIELQSINPQLGQHNHNVGCMNSNFYEVFIHIIPLCILKTLHNQLRSHGAKIGCRKTYCEGLRFLERTFHGWTFNQVD